MADHLILAFDHALRAVVGVARPSRPSPAAALPEGALSLPERRHAAALMRVNHCGEVCAQALYQGQALRAREPDLVVALRESAAEERDHLAWTGARIRELGGRPSVLNPFWYSGALLMGMVAARFGKRWNLGFLAETERQVEAHLSHHLTRLPAADGRSRAVLRAMRQDEIGHAQKAIRLGAAVLPDGVARAMRFVSRVMTRTAYYL